VLEINFTKTIAGTLEAISLGTKCLCFQSTGEQHFLLAITIEYFNF